MTFDPCSIIKAFLEEVKAGNIFASGLGLCSNLGYYCAGYSLADYEIDDIKQTFRKILRNFPKYTGNGNHPLVPPDEYYAHLHASVDFYDPSTPYGAIRREFVEWALDEIAQNEASYMKS